jgi:hypothetical protein
MRDERESQSCLPSERDRFTIWRAEAWDIWSLGYLELWCSPLIRVE